MEGIKQIVDDTNKGYEGVKGVTKKVEIQDEKLSKTSRLTCLSQVLTN